MLLSAYANVHYSGFGLKRTIDVNIFGKKHNTFMNQTRFLQIFDPNATLIFRHSFKKYVSVNNGAEEYVSHPEVRR